jgi:Cdc6-like AAA superfamily ATPase
LYRFEKVLDPESSQQKVFTEVEGHSLCNAFLNGQNCTIFVYGPTSTGKTYTMQGNAEDIIHGNAANIKS